MEDLAAANGLRAEIRAALNRALASIEVAKPAVVRVHLEGHTVRIGIGKRRLSRDAPKIWVSSLATLRCATPRLLDALAKEAGLE